MRKVSWFWGACALALGGAALLAADRAAAQACETDADCEGGLVCKSYGTVDCTASKPDCPEGSDCFVPAEEPAPDCTPTEIKECALPACATDADCPDGTVCHEQTWTECSGEARPSPACEPGQDCPAPEPAPEPECHEVTGESQCVPRYALPCETADDCGPGFTCEEQVIGWCSGSSGGGATPSDGGGSDGFAPPEGEPQPEPDPAPEPSPEPECGEERTGTFYCQPIIVTCTDASECAEGWTCETNPNGTVCGGSSSSDPAPLPPDGGGEAGAGGAEDTPLPAPPEDCVVEETENVCMPPFSQYGFGVARGEADSAASGGPATAGSDDGAQAPSDLNEPTTPGEGSHSEGSMMEAEEAKACSVTAPGAGNSGSSLLALLGLGAAFYARRRRSA